jgi:hypothetical protein
MIKAQANTTGRASVEGASIAVDALGVNPLALGVQVGLAVQGMIAVFFIVAPAMGWMIARGLGRDGARNRLLAWSVGLLLVLLSHLGLYLGLRYVVPQGVLGDATLNALCAVASVAFSVLVVRYLAWHLAEYEPKLAQKEHEAMLKEYMLPFDRARQAHMARRKGK